MTQIGIIGVGNMGSALIRGLIRAEKTTPASVWVFDVDAAKSQGLASDCGVRVAESITDVFRPGRGFVILAVKPQAMGEVLDVVAGALHEEVVLLSIAAGVSIDFMSSRLGRPARLIRAMPNAAAMVLASATALCKGGIADDADLAEAVDIFGAVGVAVPVEEKMINVVTGLSGSGPAYLFLVMEALTDGAVLMGLDRPTARALAVQTVLGAAIMAKDGAAAFSHLKDAITSPGGTTIAGLRVLERSGLRGMLMDTVGAATARAAELAGQKENA